MKKTLTIVAAVLMAAAACHAQDEATSKTIRVGYGYMPSAPHLQVAVKNNTNTFGNVLTVDADIWNVSPRINVGARLDLGASSFYEDENSSTPSIGLHYGINLSYRVLPPSVNKWDLRLTGTVGSYWCPYLSTMTEYGVGAMAAYYPFKHVGLFGELQWGKFYFNKLDNPVPDLNNCKMKVGVSFRF